MLPESPLGYHPCSVGVLTAYREPVSGQWQVGSLTGAVASKRVTEAPKGSLSADGNRAKSAKAEGSLTARQTSRAGTKVGLSDYIENYPEKVLSLKLSFLQKGCKKYS